MADGMAVLAAGLSGGAGSVLDQRQEAQDTEEKYAWADNEARIRREENLAQWGQDERMASIQSGYNIKEDVARQDKGYRVRKQEAKDVVDISITGVKDKLSETLVDNPEQLWLAKNMADKGFSFQEILGTPAQKLDPAGEKNMYEIAVIVEGEGADPIAIKSRADALIKDYNRRTVGQVDINKAKQAGLNAKETRGTAAKAEEKKVGVATTTVTKELTGKDKVQGMDTLAQMKTEQPKLFKQVAAKLLTQGVIVSSDMEEVDRIISSRSASPDGKAVLPINIDNLGSRPWQKSGQSTKDYRAELAQWKQGMAELSRQQEEDPEYMSGGVL